MFKRRRKKPPVASAVFRIRLGFWPAHRRRRCPARPLEWGICRRLGPGNGVASADAARFAPPQDSTAEMVRTYRAAKSCQGPSAGVSLPQGVQGKGELCAALVQLCPS